MATRAALVDQQAMAGRDPVADQLDRLIADTHRSLAAAMADLDASGILLDVAGLRHLQCCTAAALRVAVECERRTGRCGYRCRLPGLHCPEREPLQGVMATLRAIGWQPAVATTSWPLTCICGAPMQPTGLELGRRTKLWAACPDCGHWVTL